MVITHIRVCFLLFHDFFMICSCTDLIRSVFFLSEEPTVPTWRPSMPVNHLSRKVFVKDSNEAAKQCEAAGAQNQPAWPKQLPRFEPQNGHPNAPQKWRKKQCCGTQLYQDGIGRHSNLQVPTDLSHLAFVRALATCGYK